MYNKYKTDGPINFAEFEKMREENPDDWFPGGGDRTSANRDDAAYGR